MSSLLITRIYDIQLLIEPMKTTRKQGKGFLTGNFVKPVVQKIAASAVLLVNRGTKVVKAGERSEGTKISTGYTNKRSGLNSLRSGKGYLN